MAVQIHNEEETVEIPRAEYEAIKALGPAIAEQNTLVLEQNMQTQSAVKAVLDSLADMGQILEGFKAAISDIKITVNVPEQPTPQVTVNVPNDKKKIKVTRSRTGSIDVEEE